MAMTVSTLEGLDPFAFRTLGFQASQTSVADAAANFDSDVLRVVDAGHAWTGEGQPQASTVMRTNSLALETAKLQMQAGTAATNGLITALVKARSDLARLRAQPFEGKGLYYQRHADEFVMNVADDGNVTWVRQNEPEAVDDTITIEDTDLTQQAQEILAYAEFADLTTAGLLERITNICPTFTETADPKVLTYNAAMRGLAAAAVVAGKTSENLWEQFAPGHWEFDETDLKHELGELYLQLSSGWNSEGKYLIEAGTAAIGGGLPILYTPPGLVLVGGGILSILGGAGWILYDVFTGDDDVENGPPGIEQPTNLLGVPPDVEDDDLRGIVDDLYLDEDDPLSDAGFTTVLDAAALQGGGVQDLPDDYLARARDLRDRLDGWLVNSYGELADDTDVKYHEVTHSDGSNTHTTTVEVPRTLDYYEPEDFAISPEERQLGRRYRNQLNALLGEG